MVVNQALEFGCLSVVAAQINVEITSYDELLVLCFLQDAFQDLLCVAQWVVWTAVDAANLDVQIMYMYLEGCAFNLVIEPNFTHIFKCCVITYIDGYPS